jgi:hypothetical protein
MRIHRLHHLPSLCVLLFCLLVNPARAYDYVWCFGSGGHTALEEATQNGMCDKEAPVAPGCGFIECARETGARNCGPCLDITSSSPWGSTRSRDKGLSAGSPVLQLPVVVNVPTPSADHFLTDGHFPDSSPHIPQKILHHRTVVLLI